MTRTNVIINGTFDNKGAGWSGTDIEANHRESAYLGNGSKNRVSEIDGNKNQTTVMQQTFTVSNPLSSELTLDVALRNAALNDAGSDGFVVEILDSSGAVIATDTVYPTVNSFQPYSLPVSFPAAGDYTLRFTEVGDDDSLGPIIDNVSLLVCFAAGTLIATPSGEKDVANLQPGNLVTTRNGDRPVRWLGQMHVSAEDMKADPKLCPVRVSKDAFGAQSPSRDTFVSRQHRVSVERGDLRDVLVAAIRLCDLPGICVDHGPRDLTYIHVLLDTHEILTANGLAMESMLLAPRSIAALTPQSRSEISEIFGEPSGELRPMKPVAPIPSNAEQKRLVEGLKAEVMAG